MLTRHERAVVHQLHPAKIAVDVLSAAGALWLFWLHHLLDGVGVALVPPLVASTLIMRFDLEPLRVSISGERMLRYMTPAVQAARLLGFLVMAFGAWTQHAWIIVASVLWIVFWWWRVLTRPL